MLILETRKRETYHIDRRFYNGAWADEGVKYWGPWDWLEYDIKPEKVEERLAFWRDLTDYAASFRGSSALSEYRVREVNKEEWDKQHGYS